jgi:hypothetical protein
MFYPGPMSRGKNPSLRQAQKKQLKTISLIRIQMLILEQLLRRLSSILTLGVLLPPPNWGIAIIPTKRKLVATTEVLRNFAP